jgi:hypothetical protein
MTTKKPKSTPGGASDDPPWPSMSPPRPGQPFARFTFADGSFVDVDLRVLLRRRAGQRNFARTERARLAGEKSGRNRRATTERMVLLEAQELIQKQVKRHKWPAIIAGVIGITIPQVRRHLTSLGFPSNRKKRY